MTSPGRWVTVELTENSETIEPDWSRVPSERVEAVRAAWLARSKITRRWRMWEPQLPLFRRFYGDENVRVIDVPRDDQ